MTIPTRVDHDFLRIGARAQLLPYSDGSLARPGHVLSLDIATDERGEYFDIRLGRGVLLETIDTDPADRHLLLSARTIWNQEQFLCGHDEFHWFVAGLPVEAGATTIDEAKEALKPELVKRIESRKRRGRHPRRQDVAFRQGEWFFVPCRHASIDLRQVIRGGELVRNVGSKPHVCDLLYAEGEREYECRRHPKLAFFESEYRHLLRTRKKANQWGWKPLPYQPTRYAKGWVRHADHAPLYLDGWHRVEQNLEPKGMAIGQVVYLD